MIVKCVRHLGIDLLFRRALPELCVLDLDLSDLPRELCDPSDWRYREIAPRFHPVRSEIGDRLESAAALGWNLKEHLGIWRPDLFIVDDPGSLMVGRAVEAGRLLFYSHGDYTAPGNPWNLFLRHALSGLGGAPTLYASEWKRERGESWRQSRKVAVVPLGLPEEAFVPAPVARKARLCLVRDDALGKLTLYDERTAGLFAEIVEEWGPVADLCGRNEPSAAFGKMRLRPRAPIATLADYSVALEPWGNPSVSFAQLELMAAGVPLVTAPREGFLPGGPVPVATTMDEWRAAVGHCCAEPELIAERGRAHVREHYHESRWIADVRNFIAEL